MSRYTRRGRAEAAMRGRLEIVLGDQMSDPRVDAAYRAALAGYRPRAGEMLHLEVAHDDRCARWRGGACSCAPAVQIVDWYRPSAGAAS